MEDAWRHLRWSTADGWQPHGTGAWPLTVVGCLLAVIPAEVVERLAEIPTRFYVASACNSQLLGLAVAKVVTQHQHEIVELLARPPAQSAAR
jgi:hypothetical protein